ncbi:hypothetical protein GE061_005524 [Apolygus lucorum]|uniref:Uncharacterized protein n=1 Tax=Apolygus lucorum TaxID=248454 RepID=A0A6A4IXM3_APOLU|nr:hypothetical protein GE061_005524 [Apolygus lucorum]
MPLCIDLPDLHKAVTNNAVPKRSSLVNGTTLGPPECTTAKPYYANRKFDLYYPTKRAELDDDLGAAGSPTKNCPMTREALNYIMNLNLNPILDQVDVRKNDVLRTIQRLDEKLNSPVCRFLEAYQPNISCSCEETTHRDSECPCPPVKEPLHFDLSERAGGWETEGSQQLGSYTCGQSNLPVNNQYASDRTPDFQSYERFEIEKQVKALDEKLCSPELHFLTPLEPEQIARCACELTNFPQAHCACPPTREPINFRNKVDVQRKIDAIDGVLNSPEIGFSCSPKKPSPCICGAAKHKIDQCVCSTPTKSILKGSSATRNAKSCVSNCPPPRCRCGRDCPAQPGPFQKPPQRTFHVPTCPSDRGWMVQPRSPVEGTIACPFSPACCPIAEVCPFPVATLYDPNAPSLPPSGGPRRCPLVPTQLPSSNLGDPNRPPCPLDPLKPPRGPPSCPLTSSTGCPMGQQSECPLLTCSLGPLKSIIFDGSEECPFCGAKCCPMISPDGPGCPISINANFCPLGNTDACCLKGMSSPPPLSSANASTSGLKNDEESCPLGELLDANAKMPACKCSGQQNSCPLSPPKPCPAVSSFPQSSCSCRNTTQSAGTTNRPGSCPLGSIQIPQPPAPPCPLTLGAQGKPCPMTNLGDKNLDSSCPVSNLFECPALKKNIFSTPNQPTTGKTTDASQPKLDLNEQQKHQVTKDDKIRDTRPEQKLKNTNQQKKPKDAHTSLKNQDVSEPNKKLRNSSFRSQKGKKTSKETVKRVESETVRKTDKDMSKTFSRMTDSTHSTVSTEASEVIMLESLPRPPLSDTRLVRATRSSHESALNRDAKPRRNTALNRDAKPRREDASPFVKTSAPSDSKGFAREQTKQKPKNCPIPDPEPCPLEVPRCPFGPPEPSCPLAKVPNCPLRTGTACCMTGAMFGPQKPECPVETTPCNLFPQGHCPMENLNTCECNYPVAPCMEPLIPDEDARADDQYCSRLTCCMGLPLPPTKPSEAMETDTWYAYTDVKPGNPATKHYLEILDVPPEPEFFVSINAFRKHPAWKIIKYGEGYKECKKIKEIIAARGPTNTTGTQFVEDELPDDIEIEIIEKNQREAAKKMEKIKMEQLTLGWKD